MNRHDADELLAFAGFVVCVFLAMVCFVAAVYQLFVLDSVSGAVFNLLGVALWAWLAGRIKNG